MPRHTATGGKVDEHNHRREGGFSKSLALRDATETWLGLGVVSAKKLYEKWRCCYIFKDKGKVLLFAAYGNAAGKRLSTKPGFNKIANIKGEL